MPAAHMAHEVEDLRQAFGEQHRERAERLLRVSDETFRLVIPKRLPLDVAAHLVRRCPACGFESPTWAKLTGLDVDPTIWTRQACLDLDLLLDQVDMKALNRLACTECGRVFPDAAYPEDGRETVAGFTYPYYVGKNGERYYFTACAEFMRSKTLGYRNVFFPLCVAAMVTGSRAYADKAIGLLLLFAERFDYWPWLSFAGATVPGLRGQGIRTLAADELGTSYGGWFNMWGGSYMVTEWGLGFDLIRDTAAVAPDVYTRIRDGVVKRVLESSVYPTHVYLLDKFHNSTTNHYRAIAAALRSFGEGLVVEDIVRHTFRLTGGDIAQDLVHGAKGMRYYAETCFDACGLYSERTSGYQAYAARGLLTAATFLRGYSDPGGYEPGADVVDVYQPIEDFRIEKDLPQAARALHADVELQSSDGVHYVIGDCSPPTPRSVKEVRNLSQRCPDARLLAWEQDAIARKELPARSDMPSQVEAQAYPPTDDLVSQEYGLALLKSKGQARETLGLTWAADTDYHTHWDSLRITYRARGQDLFPDLATLYSSPYRYLWIDRTRAHSTASVHGQRQGESLGGDLLYMDRGPQAALLAAQDNSVYPELTAYRRDLVLVTEGSPYVVDCFRVQGGSLYEQTWVGASKHLSCPGLPLQPSQTREPGPAFDDPALWELNPQYADAKNGEQALREIKEARCDTDGMQKALWQLQDCVGELFVHARAGDCFVTAEFPQRINTAPPESGRMLSIERPSEPDTLQAFLAVYQIRPQAESGLEVQALAVENGCGARITHALGTDVVLMRLAADPAVCEGAGIVFDGEVLLARFQADRLVHVQAVGGTSLQIADQRLGPATPACTVRVEAVEVASRQLEVQLIKGDPAHLKGQFIHFSHQNGSTSMVRIADVASGTDGRHRLFCDGQVSRLHTHCGRVGGIVDAETLTTQTVGPENLRPGSHIYVGEACARLQASERSGRALDIDGMTSNECPREIRMQLRDSCLQEDHAGQEFWVSPFGAGDEGVMRSRFLWSSEA